MKNVNHQLFSRSVVRYLIDSELIYISTHLVFMVPASASQGDAGCKDHSDQAGAGVRVTRVSCVSIFAKGRFFVQLSNEKYPGCLGYTGDEILPSYIGTIS